MRRGRGRGRSDPPLVWAHQNLLFGPDWSAAALFRVETVSYKYLSATDKVSWMRNWAEFARNVGANFSMWRVNRQWPETYLQQALAGADERFVNPVAWEAYLTGHSERIEQLGAFYPELYLAISLQTPVTGPAAQLRERIVRELRARRARARQEPLQSKHLAQLHNHAAQILQRTGATLPVRPAKTREIQWLLKRCATRHTLEPIEDTYWAPAALTVLDLAGEPVAYEPQTDSVTRLTGAPVLEKNRALVVDADQAQTHQAIMTLGALPANSDFPGAAEFMSLPLEALPFPVDAVLHAQWLDNPVFVNQVIDKSRVADIVHEEQHKGDHAPLSGRPAANRRAGRELLADLESPAAPPGVHASISFALGPGDPDTLEKRKEALRRIFGQIKLECPRDLQAPLYRDHYLRTDGGRVRGHADRLWVLNRQGMSQFGALIPNGTHEAGHQTGVYFAHTVGGARRPVRMDLTRAPRENRPVGVYVSGALGSGKTFTLMKMAIDCAERGSRVITVDHKPDHFLENVPELAGLVEVIEPSADKAYRGLLDPLVNSPLGIREDRANSYLLELLGTAVPQNWQTQIRKAVKSVLTRPEPCCLRVLETLLSSEHSDAKAAGEALEIWADSGIARLGFSDGRPVIEDTRRVTVIRPRDLTLPAVSVARADLDPLERISVATMKLIAGFSLKLFGTDASRHKLFIFDEAKTLTDNADGMGLIQKVVLWGRTYNATPVLASQLAAHFGGLEDLVGERISLGQETAAEARKSLQIVGLDPADESLVADVCSMRQGRGFYRDLDGRVAKIQVDLVYPHLVEALSTTPPQYVPAPAAPAQTAGT